MAEYIDAEAMQKWLQEKFIKTHMDWRNIKVSVAWIWDWLDNFPRADVELKQMWISAEDKLPDSMCDILICAEGNVFPGYYNTDTGKWRDENGNLVSGVTHWMIIPNAPEG